MSSTRGRILIAGGGYVGFYAAQRLERRLRPGEADVTLVSPDNYLLYQPLLPEMASGTLEARHVMVPLRQALPRTRVKTGSLAGLDPELRLAKVATPDGQDAELGYDHLVLGVGAVSKVLPVPGLAEHAVGFKTIDEAVYLRNHLLSRLDAADASTDPQMRRRALTFVFVGGGYTGVEALAELEDLAVTACRQLRSVTPADLRFVLVEATDRILPTVSDRLAEHAARLLRRRGVDIRLETTLERVDAGEVTLEGGETIPTDTVVWVAGVVPNPVLDDLNLPVDDMGRLPVDSRLRARGVDGVWAAGDCAAVPDPAGGTFPPTAQHAQREGRHLGENLVAALRGEEPKPFRYSSPGEMVTLGHRKGVAEVFGRRIEGLPAWLLRRAYYVTAIPTANRKLRVLADWLIGIPFPREVVAFGRISGPGESLS